MDDSVLAKLQSTFLVGGDVHDTHTPHPHYALYKQRREGYGNQETRRKKSLEIQRSRRRDFVDYARRIVEGEVWEESGEGGEMEEGGYDEVDTTEDKEEKMEATKTKKRKKKKKFFPYRNQLMLSEWLVDVPKDFEEKWFMFVCPVGKRSLVVSAKGTTSAYSRLGKCIKNFPSLLPGGCAKTHRQARDYCILDCIFYEGTQTYYVLDIMCWGGHPVYDSDTEFRAFWKATKIRDDADKLCKYSRFNPLPFIDLPAYPSTKESITQVLSGNWPVQVDGLLFIHKEAHYCPNRTPLATWLKVHMVPDILGLPVSQEFLACAPTLSEVSMDSVDSEGTDRSSKRAGGKNKSKRVPQEGMDVSTELSKSDESSIQSEN